MSNLIETDVAVVGAGPVGLFSVFEAGMAGYKCAVIDSLEEIGGQLSALYPEKPIYDIPGHPEILAEDLVKNLEKQAAPFKPNYLLGNEVSTLEQHEDGSFTLQAGENTVKARAVCVAAGGGMFAPRKPPVENLEQFEGTSVFYSVRGKDKLADKEIVIAGGGDSAVDWAVELAPKAKHIHVIHRRAQFRAAEETVNQMHALAEAGKVTLHTPAQLKAVKGESEQLTHVTIADLDGNETELNADTLLCFFGIAPSLGPVAKWGLGVEKKKISVDPETMATTVKGITAVGDIAHYPAKRHLILMGFSECAVAIKTMQAHMDPDRKFKDSFSTSTGVPSL